MSQLAELLQAAVDETRFDLGRRRTSGNAADISYSGVPERVVSPRELREILDHRPYHDDKTHRARSAKPLISRDTLSRLTEHLETILQDFIDPSTGRVGHAFPVGLSDSTMLGFGGDGILGYRALSSVPAIATAIIRGAALLTPNQMSQLVESWIQGEGAVFRTRALLNDSGVLERPLNPLDGVQIEPLPLSTDHLIGYLPDRSGTEPRHYLGRTVISIEHKVQPVLYLPRNVDSVTASWHTEVPGTDIATVCLAFALETGHYAEPAFYWTDYLSLEACSLGRTQDTWAPSSPGFKSYQHSGVSLSTSFPDNVSTLRVREGARLSVDDRSLRAITLSLADNRSGSNRIAAARWVNAKGGRSSLADRFIELRIALEALYLRDLPDRYRGEMRFRLALYGAWHLGSDTAERHRVRKILLDAYSAGSTAVHSGHVEWTSENSELLDKARDLCRQGLLKFLREGPPKDWWELILGGEIPVDQA